MPATEKKVSAREAAIQIAKRVKEPIKVSDLVERVLKMKGVELKGKTPKATISAQIYTECARPEGKLQKVERGVVQYRS